ncbi:transposase [Streptomyces californicus]|uniref:transposase n=1 Tax=Streptomyces californicus TaxID=67351 RepID=UPI0033FD7172
MDDELRALVEPLLLPWPERSPGPRARAGPALPPRHPVRPLQRQSLAAPAPGAGVGPGQTCWRRLDRWQKKSPADNNRQAICGTTKFTKDPTITDDSCDEFPFAGAYESGALNGVDHGKDCAQVTAVKKRSGTGLPTVWPTVAVIGTPSGNEKCVRGHIPGPLNSDLGGAYGNFVISARLADDDALWLQIAF